MQSRRQNSHSAPQPDILAAYPDMMSTYDLAEFMNVGYATAWKTMQKLPWVNVGLGQTNQSRRVHKQYVRDHFNLPDPTIRQPNFDSSKPKRYPRYSR